MCGVKEYQSSKPNRSRYYSVKHESPWGRHIHKIARLERAFIGYCVCQDRMRTRRSLFDKFVRNKFERPNDCMDAGAIAADDPQGAVQDAQSNPLGIQLVLIIRP